VVQDTMTAIVTICISIIISINKHIDIRFSAHDAFLE
jgi:hypothetical protein